MYRKPTATPVNVLLIALRLTPLLAGAQGSVETQKGLPVQVKNSIYLSHLNFLYRLHC